MTTISSVRGFEALDSRGRPTVGCVVELAGGARGRVVVPSGASTGQYEAYELRDGGPRYEGFGVLGAVRSVNEVLATAVTGLEAADQEQVDLAMEAADGTPTLAVLGGNAVLAVSLAVMIADAQGAGCELWQRLSDSETPLLPMPMVNIFSGGAHAGHAIDIQDVLVVPVGAASFAEAMEWVSRVRLASAVILESRGGSAALVADEGGLGGRLASNAEALSLVTEGIEAAGFVPGVDVGIAVDLAANQFWDGSHYVLRAEHLRLTPSDWLSVVAGWCEQFPIVSVEDVLSDDDWSGWREASQSLGVGRQLLGDDLFATNASRLRRAIDSAVGNAVLVKPNQAGTVSRALAVVRMAQVNGYATVVSARSGDTEDAWLADLAVGWRSGQIKVGSTMRSERTAKWNRLLEIEALDQGHTRFAGRGGLAGQTVDAPGTG